MVPVFLTGYGLFPYFYFIVNEIMRHGLNCTLWLISIQCWRHLHQGMQSVGPAGWVGVQDGIELCTCVRGCCSASLGCNLRKIKPQAIPRQSGPGGSLIFVRNELVLKDVINRGTYSMCRHVRWVKAARGPHDARKPATMFFFCTAAIWYVDSY